MPTVCALVLLKACLMGHLQQPMFIARNGVSEAKDKFLGAGAVRECSEAYSAA